MNDIMDVSKAKNLGVYIKGDFETFKQFISAFGPFKGELNDTLQSLGPYMRSQ